MRAEVGGGGGGAGGAVRAVWGSWARVRYRLEVALPLVARRLARISRIFLRAQVAADRAQGRSARRGAELGLLGGEAAEVIHRASRASNAVAVQHARRGARLGWLGLG